MDNVCNRRLFSISNQYLILVHKFNDYTFGNKTIVFSDHKSLEPILKKRLRRAPKHNSSSDVLIWK